MRKLTAIYS